MIWVWWGLALGLGLLAWQWGRRVRWRRSALEEDLREARSKHRRALQTGDVFKGRLMKLTDACNEALEVLPESEAAVELKVATERFGWR